MGKLDYIILAGGCFWGLEHLLARQTGVLRTEVGYTGGELKDPSYENVCTGETHHAEAVKVTFDSEQTGLEELLHYFFRIHDPTTLNHQGHDQGTQYRSALFLRTEDQKSRAQKVIQEVNESGRWAKPVVTTLEPEQEFYLAEEYHQKYLEKNPQGYSCHFFRE